MLHEILSVGILECNCSVVADDKTKEAIVIDPGDEVERVQKILTRHDLKVRYIIATHAHIDHVGGLKKLHASTGAPVLMHQADLPLYDNLAAQAAWLGVEAPGKV
ncbi:MAG TPA: MBL fold metallo-hydrolase, partial [Terriglobia bacterium]|nr:MBL fold metallo-hydrolase [Terriglobia bacterium]